MTAILDFIFGTAIGRTLLVVGLVAGCWWAFSSHYIEQGKIECRAEYAEAQNKANADQIDENNRKEQAGNEIAKDADQAAEELVKETDHDVVSTKEEIRDVYKAPPATAPIALDSCVHPLDERVQERIDGAVRQANNP